MSPADYAAWLAGGEKNESMAEQGRSVCSDQFGAAAPAIATKTKGHRIHSLAGIYGKPQKLQNGETRVLDETEIRDSILTPNSVQIPGFAPIMHTYVRARWMRSRRATS